MKRRLRLPALSLAVTLAFTGVAIAASSPSVATDSATLIGSSSAVLNGHVNPNGATTAYNFDVGLTTAYGIVTPTQELGKLTKSVRVKAPVSDLLPGTVYHYRLAAINAAGGALGGDRTFKTSGSPPPEVATGPANDLGPFSANLTGVVNQHGAATTYVFQYGTTISYGYETFSRVVPAGETPVTVTEALTALEPGTIFHYRIVAVHAGSVTQYGSDATFATLPYPTPVPRVNARTVPHRRRDAPYVFFTSGRLVAARSIFSGVECFQNLTIRYFLGRRQVMFLLVPVQPDCTFSGQAVFRRLPGRGRKGRQVHLRILIHFRGNGYLAPANAKTETVTLG
ncbi:MAG: hypothetical protein ACYC91_13645 [Solirubrobacteraceae bacterium]